jgi:hypothetical protein
MESHIIKFLIELGRGGKDVRGITCLANFELLSLPSATKNNQ